MQAEPGATRVTFEGATSVSLIECKLRGSEFVPVKGAKTKVYGWRELVDLLAPHKSQDGFRQLRKAKTGAFLGLSKSPMNGHVGTFFMLNDDLSGNIEMKLKVDPTFEGRLVCVYRVEAAKWPVTLTERKSA